MTYSSAPFHVRVAAVLADTGAPPWVAIRVADAMGSVSGLPPDWRNEFMRIANGPPLSAPPGWPDVN